MLFLHSKMKASRKNGQTQQMKKWSNERIVMCPGSSPLITRWYSSSTASTLEEPRINSWRCVGYTQRYCNPIPGWWISQDAPKHKLARLLETTDDNVHRRFVGSEPGTCVDLEKPFEQKSLRTDYVYTILALNDISYSNGLPALGQDEKVYSLQKGEALHFMGDQSQKWSGRGGGNLIWFYWRNLNIRK